MSVNSDESVLSRESVATGNKRCRRAQRGRAWCFTDFQCDPSFYQSLVDNGAQYAAYGEETCPTTGRRHFQAFVYFRNAITWNSVKKKLTPRNFTLIRGSFRDNTNYCSKEGSLNEYGLRPLSDQDKGLNEKIRWDSAISLAKEGKIDQIDGDMQVRYYSTWRKYQMDFMPKPLPLESTCGIWISGPPGMGKSQYVWDNYPHHFRKTRSKQWNGYQGEDVVWLDEISPDCTKWITEYLKEWGDKFPFKADVKYSELYIRPKCFIITSNYSIDNMGFLNTDLGAIKRRFKEYYMFSLGNITE